MEYIETSNSSIGIGLIVFISSLVVSRHYLNSYYMKKGIEEDNNYTLFYSFMISLFLSFLCLFLLKQYFIYKGSMAILNEPFISTNIVSENV